MRLGDLDRAIARSGFIGRQKASPLRDVGFRYVAGLVSQQCAEIVPNQKDETRHSCDRSAFEFFSGAPARLVIDNPKDVSIWTCYHDPEVQRTYSVNNGFVFDKSTGLEMDTIGGIGHYLGQPLPPQTSTSPNGDTPSPIDYSAPQRSTASGTAAIASSLKKKAIAAQTITTGASKTPTTYPVRNPRIATSTWLH